VIALPPGFMALHDRQARDLALAHELAHHHGGDLLANVLVQPLFALHWWNPLASYGWLALPRPTRWPRRWPAPCSAKNPSFTA
jgi:bla regulator protein blaR1